MVSEKPQTTTKIFKFNYPTCTNEELQFKLEVPVEIPHGGCVRELVQRLVRMFRVPVYLEDKLNERLSEFVRRETEDFHNDRDEHLLNSLKNAEVDVEGVVRNWEKLFKENVVEFAEQKGTSDEEVFAAAYHSLVHSPVLESILQAERSYARVVRATLAGRDHDIAELTKRQTEEMEDVVDRVSGDGSEAEVNALAAQHFEQQSLAAARWGSQLSALKHAQRNAHRAWLMAALSDETMDETLIDTHADTHTDTQPLCGSAEGPASREVRPPRLEESFTIHLGSQLKQTHNIRIVCADLLQLCHVAQHDPTEISRRLQTSLSLYSSELSAVVLLSEAPPERPAPPTTSLMRAAADATEHHFPDVETQLRDIVAQLREPVERRNCARFQESEAGRGARSRRNLQAGDIFLTKHSNLAEVHVVFHLMVDDSSLKSGDITSRHPAILGLRNILKACCSNDVTSVSLPLLLRHEHGEEMSTSWCLRRAELVLKCVKGFMLEAGGWGGSELRTLTAALPPDTQPDAFAALARLLPDIFRQASPVKVKPAPAPGPAH